MAILTSRARLMSYSLRSRASVPASSSLGTVVDARDREGALVRPIQSGRVYSFQNGPRIAFDQLLLFLEDSDLFILENGSTLIIE